MPQWPALDHSVLLDKSLAGGKSIEATFGAEISFPEACGFLGEY